MLGGVPGHTALLPRQQLSAILLCPVLLSGTLVRMMENARPPAEKSLSSYRTPLLYPKQKSLHWERHTLAGARVIRQISPVCHSRSRLRSM